MAGFKPPELSQGEDDILPEGTYRCVLEHLAFKPSRDKKSMNLTQRWKHLDLDEDNPFVDTAIFNNVNFQNSTRWLFPKQMEQLTGEKYEDLLESDGSFPEDFCSKYVGTVAELVITHAIDKRDETGQTLQLKVEEIIRDDEAPTRTRL